MTFDPTKALRYISELDLTDVYRNVLPQAASDEVSAPFDQAKAQAQVVGSGVFAFEQGVTPELRESISNCALLAQLVANKRVDVNLDPLGWFATYAEVLQNLGWTIQDDSWTEDASAGSIVEVHEKILDVAAVALGPATTAFTIVKTAVLALKGMNADSSWFRIFNRESQKTKIARFQVGLVSTDAGGDSSVRLFAFVIDAATNETQLLFFKFKNARARFRARSTTVSVNKDAMLELKEGVRKKTREFQNDYLSSIVDI